MNTERHLRIGKIDYTNVWPVFHHFPASELGSEVELIEQVPTQLNRAMAEGRIDMGAISSFAYGAGHVQYYLFPDLSVSAFGHVHSILLFTREPIERALKGRVALTTASATSVNLLKVIAALRYDAQPDYFAADPDLDEMMREADAALLIGDDAIRENWRNETYRVYDLGDEWRKWTGKWMTFAVWAVRRQAVEEKPELVEKVLSLFLRSKTLGLAEPDGMIANALARVGGTAAFWRAYFTNLCYDFGTDQQSGLRQYYACCAQLGLLPDEPPLRLWPQIQSARVTE